MRLWILFGAGVLVVAAAIWPWGRRTEQLGTVPVNSGVAVKPTPAPAAKPEPTKVIEVIDLARAYEPVREPEEPAGTVNPASFIQIPEGPQRIPPAIDLSGGVPARIGASPSGAYIFGMFVPGPERFGVMPREVPTGLRNWTFVPKPQAAGQLVFTPMGVPYAVPITQPIPPGALIERAAPVEALKVMPREVNVQMRMAQLLNECEDLRQAREEWHRYWMNNQPSVLTYDRLNGVIERAAPVEQLKVMPREVGRVKREEQERSTGVREDDFVGKVGP